MLPPISPAATIATYRSSKTLGCLARAAERLVPESTSSWTLRSTAAKCLFSTWLASTAIERLIESPESTIVANCRVKTATSFGLMRSEKPGMMISVFRPLPLAGATETGR